MSLVHEVSNASAYGIATSGNTTKLNLTSTAVNHTVEPGYMYRITSDEAFFYSAQNTGDADVDDTGVRVPAEVIEFVRCQTQNVISIVSDGVDGRVWVTKMIPAAAWVR